jgi:hypothetical protein
MIEIRELRVENRCWVFRNLSGEGSLCSLTLYQDYTGQFAETILTNFVDFISELLKQTAVGADTF